MICDSPVLLSLFGKSADLQVYNAGQGLARESRLVVSQLAAIVPILAANSG